MDFESWLKADPERVRIVAKRCRIGPRAVRHWQSGAGVPPDRMLTVRELSGGEVSLEEMLAAKPVKSRPAKRRR